MFKPIDSQYHDVQITKSVKIIKRKKIPQKKKKIRKNHLVSSEAEGPLNTWALSSGKGANEESRFRVPKPPNI